MAKAKYPCPECGRAVTKQVKFIEETKEFASLYFKCDHCEEELVAGWSENRVLVVKNDCREVE